jgi:tRNA(Ile)-lysidine synthase
MKLKFVSQIQRQDVYVACSGGADSLALLHFARQKGLNPVLWHFNHADENASAEESFCVNHAKEYGFSVMIDRYTGPVKPLRKSPKEFYRDIRYEAMQKLNKTVLIGHTLDDVVEGYLFSFLRYGEGYMIPYQRDNAIRPFLLNTKEDCTEFLQKKNIYWYEDPTNTDVRYTRNLIRHELLPIVSGVNPGFRKVVKRKFIQKLQNDKIL